MTKGLIKTLAEIEGSDLAAVGPKAFHLARLKQHGFPVPEGVVLTASFFEKYLHLTHLLPLWQGRVEDETAPLLALSDALANVPMPAELAEMMRDRLNYCLPSVPSFAVRSSAPEEDISGSTFAGLHLSRLGVPPSELEEAVRDCWASAFSLPALTYRQEHGFPLVHIPMAVLIQAMVQPDVAGVAFTADPVTGSREALIIEAAPGRDATITSRDVSPQRYYLPRAGWPEGQAEDVSLLPEGRLLSKGDLHELRSMLLRVEALMGDPQDVEWALEKGRVYLLQARPIVSLPCRREGPDLEWTRAGFRQNLPELPSPFVVSLLERCQPGALSPFSKIGVDVSAYGPHLKVICGRPYLNVTLLKQAMMSLGLPGVALLEAMGLAEGSAESLKSWRVRPGQALRSLRRLWRWYQTGREAERWVWAFEFLVNDVVADLEGVDGEEFSQEKALRRLQLQGHFYDSCLSTDLVTAWAITTQLTGIGMALGRYAPGVAGSMSALLVTSPQHLAIQQAKDLLSLGRLARQEAPARAYLCSERDDFSDFAAVLAGTDTLKEFHRLLSRYGCHSPFNSDPAIPRFSEDPTPLLQALVRYICSPDLPGPPRLKERDQKPMPGAWEQLREGLPWWERIVPWRLLLVRHCLGGLECLLSLRGRIRAAESRGVAAWRAWGLALGRRWVGEGWLERAEDVFWLTASEIERGLTLSPARATLAASVRIRKDEYAGHAPRKMPDWLRESEIPKTQAGWLAEMPPDRGVLTGVPISPGMACGPALVVYSRQDFPKIRKGAIIVASVIVPAWMPLFSSLAAGLVVETGGLLSHSSILARECGLPAVGGVANATSRLPEGAQILVDGSTGVVQILAT
jgi:phosphohistidine swiveling domain-containing protein